MEQKKMIAIYGAGIRESAYYDFCVEKGLESIIYGLCDKNRNEIKEVRWLCVNSSFK